MKKSLLYSSVQPESGREVRKRYLMAPPSKKLKNGKSLLFLVKRGESNLFLALKR